MLEKETERCESGTVCLSWSVKEPTMQLLGCNEVFKKHGDFVQLFI